MTSQVVVFLKSVAEDAVLTLADGTRLFRDAAAGTPTIHPDFALIVLANRPGYPFLGNDLLEVTRFRCC